MAKKLKEGLIIGVVLLLVILVWIVIGFTPYFMGPDWPTRGTMGDMFGASNSLFSGLGFLGILVALYYQRQEIKLQHSEIELNRQEIQRSARLQEKAQLIMTDQVEQMRVAAQLNAMNTMVNYYNIQIANPNITADKLDLAKTKRRELIHRIDDLINDFEDTELD